MVICPDCKRKTVTYNVKNLLVHPYSDEEEENEENE